MWNFRRQSRNKKPVLDYPTKDELSKYSSKPITNHEKNMTFKRYDWEGIRRCKTYVDEQYEYNKDPSRWRFNMGVCELITPQYSFNMEYDRCVRSATRFHGESFYFFGEKEYIARQNMDVLKCEQQKFASEQKYKSQL